MIPCCIDMGGTVCDCGDVLCPNGCGDPRDTNIDRRQLRMQKDDALLAAHRVVVEAARGVEPTRRYVVFAVVNAHGDQDDVHRNLGNILDAIGVDYECIAVYPRERGQIDE